MEEALTVTIDPGERRSEQNRRISEVIQQEGQRLLHFIRKRVGDEGDAEDILQEVFYELVETYRLMKPIEQVSAWLFRGARNRITDLFRKKKPLAFSEGPAAVSEDGEALLLQDLLPSPDAGPDAVYARSVLIEELEAETGLSVNALVLRKHHAVQHLARTSSGHPRRVCGVLRSAI